MKKLLLLWLMMAPMSGMAQNETLRTRIRRRYDNERANLRRSLPERTEYGKPHRTERPPLLQKEQQEKQI